MNFTDWRSYFLLSSHTEKIKQIKIDMSATFFFQGFDNISKQFDVPNCNLPSKLIYHKVSTESSFMHRSNVLHHHLPFGFVQFVRQFHEGAQTIGQDRAKQEIRSPISKIHRASIHAMQQQHNTTQHNTTQHNTTQHNTTQHNTTQHNTAQQQRKPYHFLISGSISRAKADHCA